MTELLDKLCRQRRLEKEEWRALLAERFALDRQALFDRAAAERRKWYGDAIYVRGLIECSNICKNDCRYCGIRRSNTRAARYRLDRSTILACCEKGYGWGFRTFVLQGGEDGGLTPDWVADTVRAIKERFPDCAVTLSLGEFDREIYQLWFDAGADRYLLRHETADRAHYQKLHPPELTLEHRLDCLRILKDIGYQVGAGFMVGSPGQSADTLAADFCFLQDFRPHMVGLGPFIPQKDTPFAGEKAGTLEDTLILLSQCREGFGDPDCEAQICAYDTMEEREKALRADFSIGGFVGFLFAETAEHYHMILVTDLPSERFGHTKIQVARTLDEALALAAQYSGGSLEGVETTLMPHGGSTFPLPQA